MLIHNADITGSLTINGIPYNTGSFSGSFTGAVAGTTSTASYVEYNNVANKPALVSGSSQITYSGLTGIPSGIVSGSSQVTYSGLTGIPSGIVSGSAQIAGFGIFVTTGSNQFNGSQAITGSLTTTGTIVAQTLNVQQVTSSVVYSSGSNIFGNSVANTQQFTGSVSITGSLNTSIAAFGSAASLYLVSDGGTIKSRTAAQTLSDIAALPLAGGTLTGALNGTSATFTGTVTFAANSKMEGSGAPNFVLSSTSAVGSGVGPYQTFKTNNSDFGYIGSDDALLSTTGNRLALLGLNGLIFRTGASYLPSLTLASTGAATFTNSITSNYTYNGGGVGMLHLTSNGTEGGSITFEKTSGTTQKYKIGNSGAAFFVYDETGAKQPFTILNNGNVGIGSATSPVAALNVSNVPTSYFGIIETTGTSAGTVKHFRVHKPFYVEYGIGILADNSFHISTASTFPTTNGFTITSAGNVGIGTTAPISTLLNSALTIYKVYNSDSSSIPSPNAQLYGNNQSGLYLFGRNSGLTIVGANSEQNQIIFANNSTVAYASINTTTGTNSVGGDMYFNVGSNTERMRITSDGYVTKPYQPSFRAGLSASYNPGANSNIVFNNVLFNTGGHYNATTGLFTAPIAGVYYFSASVIWESVPDGQAMDDAFDIRVNGGLVAYEFRRGEYVAGTTGNGGYYVTNSNVLVNLAANDNVSIRNYRSLTVHGNFYFTWFAGYLLG